MKLYINDFLKCHKYETQTDTVCPNIESFKLTANEIM